MNRKVSIPIHSILPPVARVLEIQGMPPDVPVPEPVTQLFDQAVDIFGRLATPIALCESISQEAFDALFFDGHKSEVKIPLRDVLFRAEFLALFAVTVGSAPENRAETLFSQGNLALAVMLDAVSSVAAENASDFCGKCFLEAISGGQGKNGAMVLGYSPGYCGWPLSAQQDLWSALRPQEIGMSLNESCMMSPRKSVSGVLVLGSSQTHRIQRSYDVCRACSTHECIQRQTRALTIGSGGA